GTLGTYLGTDDDAPDEGAPWVRLDTGEHVLAWADVLAPVEDHGTGDGSASDICAEPGWRRLPAPVVDDLWDAKDRVQREVAAEVFTAPAPLDPSGRHELAADFFHAKTGTAASYFTVDLSPEERAPYYAAADVFLAAHLTPEPERKPGPVADIEIFGDTELRALSGGSRGEWHAESGDTYRQPEEVTDVRPLVVIDPADVDVVALQREIDYAMPGHEASVVLERLGLNR